MAVPSRPQTPLDGTGLFTLVVHQHLICFLNRRLIQSSRKTDYPFWPCGWGGCAIPQRNSLFALIALIPTSFLTPIRCFSSTCYQHKGRMGLIGRFGLFPWFSQTRDGCSLVAEEGAQRSSAASCTLDPYSRRLSWDRFPGTFATKPGWRGSQYAHIPLFQDPYRLQELPARDWPQSWQQML